MGGKAEARRGNITKAVLAESTEQGESISKNLESTFLEKAKHKFRLDREQSKAIKPSLPI